MSLEDRFLAFPVFTREQLAKAPDGSTPVVFVTARENGKFEFFADQHEIAGDLPSCVVVMKQIGEEDTYRGFEWVPALLELPECKDLHAIGVIEYWPDDEVDSAECPIGPTPAQLGAWLAPNPALKWIFPWNLSEDVRAAVRAGLITARQGWAYFPELVAAWSTNPFLPDPDLGAGGQPGWLSSNPSRAITAMRGSHDAYISRESLTDFGEGNGRFHTSWASFCESEALGAECIDLRPATGSEWASGPRGFEEWLAAANSRKVSLASLCPKKVATWGDAWTKLCISEAVPSVTHLTIWGAELSEIAQAVRSCPNLTCIEFRNVDLTQAHLEVLDNHPSLQQVKLGSGVCLQDEAVFADPFGPLESELRASIERMFGAAATETEAVFSLNREISVEIESSCKGVHLSPAELLAWMQSPGTDRTVRRSRDWIQASLDRTGQVEALELAIAHVPGLVEAIARAPFLPDSRFADQQTVATIRTRACSLLVEHGMCRSDFWGIAGASRGASWGASWGDSFALEPKLIEAYLDEHARSAREDLQEKCPDWKPSDLLWAAYVLAAKQGPKAGDRRFLVNGLDLGAYVESMINPLFPYDKMGRSLSGQVESGVLDPLKRALTSTEGSIEVKIDSGAREWKTFGVPEGEVDEMLWYFWLLGKLCPAGFRRLTIVIESEYYYLPPLHLVRGLQFLEQVESLDLTLVCMGPHAETYEIGAPIPFGTLPSSPIDVRFLEGAEDLRRFVLRGGRGALAAPLTPEDIRAELPNDCEFEYDESLFENLNLSRLRCPCCGGRNFSGEYGSNYGQVSSFYRVSAKTRSSEAPRGAGLTWVQEAMSKLAATLEGIEVDNYESLCELEEDGVIDISSELASASGIEPIIHDMTCVGCGSKVDAGEPLASWLSRSYEDEIDDAFIYFRNKVTARGESVFTDFLRGPLEQRSRRAAGFIVAYLSEHELGCPDCGGELEFSWETTWAEHSIEKQGGSISVSVDHPVHAELEADSTIQNSWMERLDHPNATAVRYGCSAGCWSILDV